MSGAGGERADVSPVAQEVRRNEGRGSETSGGAGAGERTVEEVGGGPEPGRTDAEGDRAGKLLSPSRKRAAVAHLESEFEVSERCACEVVEQPRSTQRYEPHDADDEGPLVTRMLELVRAHPRYGYRRIWALLRREGFVVNRKRIWRLWRQEGLKVPQKQRKKRRLGTSANGCVRRRAERKDQVWAWD